MVIHTIVPDLPCEHEYRSGGCVRGSYCTHPDLKGMRQICSLRICPKFLKMVERTETLKEADNFYFIEKLGVHK